MVQVRGYTEDDVDVLSDEFAGIIQRSLQRAVASAADALTGIVAAGRPHVFHLPGKHNQETHGRSRQREPKVLAPYGDWGGQGKRPWMGSADPDVRSAGIWAETVKGKDAVVATMRNMHDGQVDPTHGVSLEGEPFKTYSSTFHYETDETYGMDHVRDDVFNAASHLDMRLESAPAVHTPLYRGMRVEGAEGRFHVGDQFDSDVSSWSGYKSVADSYTTPAPTQGRPVHGRAVIMRMGPGARAVSLDEHLPESMQWNEHLVRGTFKITGVSTEPFTDALIVDVEQLW